MEKYRLLLSDFISKCPYGYYCDKNNGIRHSQNNISLAKKIYSMTPKISDEIMVTSLCSELIKISLDFLFENDLKYSIPIKKRVTNNEMLEKLLQCLKIANSKHPIFSLSWSDGYRVVKEELREFCLSLVFEDRKRQIAECCDLVSVCIRFMQHEWKNAESNND